MAMRRTLAAACTALALCAAAQDDYLDSELRARVEALKSAVAAESTGPGTREERVRVLWDWMNAYSLTGGTLPVNAVFVAMSVLTYPDSADGTGATVDAFVREFTLLDEQPAAIGALTADLGPHVAGAFVTVRQTYTLATKPIEPGGGFLVTRHFMAGYGRWQTEDPAADHYISISSSNPDVRFVADGHPLGGMHGGFRGALPTLLFRVEAGTLTQGDTVTITYGDTSGGSRGLRMSTISSDRMPLPLYLDFDGSKLFFTLPIQHIIVSGAETAGVHGFAPSVVATREPFDLSVRAEDRYYNRGTGAIPGWEILLNGDPFRSLDAGGDAIQLVEEVSLDAPGVYRFTIRSQDGSIVGEANPILVEDDPQRRVYWGDTHGHSGFAEGIGTPDRFMTWARDDARLDYVMHSEHDIWLDDYEWNVLADNVRRFTEEGEFIAYLGYEWTVNNRQGGHHNVLFRTPDDRMPIRAQFFPTLSNLYQGLRTHHDARDVVVIPHAHQNGEYRLNDPLLEPLIEIMSNHGTFEWFGRMYLSHGHEVGFTAASDNHLSQPGYSAPLPGGLAQTGGLGALIAQERTTDALFDAMKDLSAYATNGDRIVLDFRLNDAQMGTRAPFAETRRIEGRVVGTAPIDTVTVVRNDAVIWERDVATLGDDAPADGTYQLTFETSSLPLHPRDNPRGWRHWAGTLKVSGATVVSATPRDFQDLAATEFEAVGIGAFEFHTQTRGETSSIALELSDVTESATLDLDLMEAMETGGAPQIFSQHNLVPAAKVTLRLADMEDGRTAAELPIGPWVDRVVLRRVVTEGPRDLKFSLEDTGTLQGDYYYVRVTQMNDAIAWSSPIWVGGYGKR